ncbi:MAG: cytochrome c [Rhodoferax sp.]|nr:cytochrome c [Rhodoferax sp.]
MTNTRQLLLALLATAFLSACDQGGRDPHPQQLQSKRLAIFKQFTKALEPMGLVARDRRDYVKVEFAEQARALKTLATQPWVYFSAEGNYRPTRAKPEVWRQPADFKLAQDRFLAAVSQLAQAADSADLPTIRSSVDEVQKSCKNCHDQFRSETVLRD